MASPATDADAAADAERCVLTEKDLEMEPGLKPMDVHGRLVLLARVDRRVESALCFYLHEVDERQLYIDYGHACTVDYALECLGFENRKTRTLLHLARRFEELPKMKASFGRGDIPYTKAREAVKVATANNEDEWIDKCKKLSNRQLEQAVKDELPPQKTRTLVLVLDEERIETWERTREAMEKLAGKTLTEIEVFDLTCAESLCTHDLTPPLGDPEAPMGGYVAKVIERDRFRCQRPGCSNRSALTGSHVKSRGRGGSEEPENILTVCMVCHAAIERGLLKTTGRAPDKITWEGPFGVIEEPLEAADEKISATGDARCEEASDERIEPVEPIEPDELVVPPMVREAGPVYGEQVHDSRESSLPISATSQSGELLGGTLEEIASMKHREDPRDIAREQVNREYRLVEGAGCVKTHVSHGSSSDLAPYLERWDFTDRKSGSRH